MKKRSRKIDVLRGMMIAFVVIAHFNRGYLHDIIFLFHMPLFFILSGVLLNRDKLVAERSYLIGKMKSLLVPYMIYLVIDTYFIQREWSIKSLVEVIWGGRAIGGVYWYITCYLFTILMFTILLRKFPDRMVKFLILVGGG